MVVEDEVETVVSSEDESVDITIGMDEINLDDDEMMELENALTNAVEEQLSKETKGANYQVVRIIVKIYSCTKTIRKVIQVQIHMQGTRTLTSVQGTILPETEGQVMVLRDTP